MRKISIAQALKLFKLLGVQVAEVVADDKDATPDVKEDDLITEVDNSRSAILRPRIEQELKDANDTAFKGRMLGTLKSAIARATGVQTKDLEGVETAEDMIKKALATYDTKFSTDTQALRDQIKQMETAHTDALTKEKETWEQKVKDANDKYIERDIDMNLAGLLKEIPRTGGDEMTQAALYKMYARSLYHLHYDEKTGKVELRQKDKPESPALNEAGTLVISPKDHMQGWLKQVGLAASDNRHQNPSDAMNKNNEGGDTKKTTDTMQPQNEIASHIDNLLNQE